MLGKECRAQGSLEILLLLAGAIVVAITIGLLVKGIANQSSGQLPAA